MGERHDEVEPCTDGATLCGGPGPLDCWNHTARSGCCVNPTNIAQTEEMVLRVKYPDHPRVAPAPVPEVDVERLRQMRAHAFEPHADVFDQVLDAFEAERAAREAAEARVAALEALIRWGWTEDPKPDLDASASNLLREVLDAG
jgi:hypothetical protein